MLTRAAAAAFMLLGSPVHSSALQDAAPAAPTARAVRVDRPPVIDGELLTEEVWRAAVPVEGFWQTRPVDGAPASERTEVRVLYTARALYIGVVCYDASPAEIIVADRRRDSPLDNTDSFRLILDTYRDRQGGFVFGTNPAGLEYDGQVTNEGQGSGIGPPGTNQVSGAGGGFNLNWDGAWRVGTRVHDEGWSAEFEIPFRTLRFPEADVQSWGLNFERRIRRRNETAFWAPLPRQFDLFRVSLAGTLEGLAIPTQRNLKVVPYVLGEASDQAFPPADADLDGEAGIDVKYSLTPSLTLDGTINTDFAQVEVDEQQINLDRFNLFFPEKRPFFLENAGLFAVGSPGEVEVFFSRRIGIAANGSAIPIRAGVRLSGQAGRGLNIGVLNMQTAQVDFVAPGNNFTVARLRQELRNRSSVGAIFINREQTSAFAGTADHNRSLAIDGRWGIGRTGLVSGYVAQTLTPGRDGGDHAYQIGARRDTQAWELSAGYIDVGRNFNPEVGFLTRSGGFRKPEFLIFHRYRPADFLKLQEIRPHTSYRGFWKPDGFHESGQLHIDSHWEFKSGHEVHTGMNLTHEGVREPFILAGVLVPPGIYDHQEAQIVAFTNEGAPWGFRIRATIGGFFGGDRIALAPAFRFRLSETFNAELSLTRNDADLPLGRFTTNLARARVSYSFTPRTFVQALVQYNDDASVWSANIRFGWLQQANTGLFIVYNDTQDLEDAGLRANRPVTGRSLIVKISRMIDLLR
jgi:hypothetical protein